MRIPIITDGAYRNKYRIILTVFRFSTIKNSQNSSYISENLKLRFRLGRITWEFDYFVQTFNRKKLLDILLE